MRKCSGPLIAHLRRRCIVIVYLLFILTSYTAALHPFPIDLPNSNMFTDKVLSPFSLKECSFISWLLNISWKYQYKGLQKHAFYKFQECFNVLMFYGISCCCIYRLAQCHFSSFFCHILKLKQRTTGSTLRPNCLLVYSKIRWETKFNIKEK